MVKETHQVNFPAYAAYAAYAAYRCTHVRTYAPHSQTQLSPSFYFRAHSSPFMLIHLNSCPFVDVY